jgi:hypothetical protein
MPEMSSVYDSAWSRDYHDDTGSQIPRFGNLVRFRCSPANRRLALGTRLGWPNPRVEMPTKMNPGWRRRRHQRSSAAGASCSAQPRPLGACCCTQPRRLGDSGALMTSRSTKQQIWFTELRVTTSTEVKSSSTLAEGTKIELSRGRNRVLNGISYFGNCYVYRYR